MTSQSRFARALRFLRGPSPIYMSAAVLARLGSFVLIPVYTRRLTTVDYGHYALAQTLLVLLPSILTLGLFASIPRFYYDAADDTKGRAVVGGIARGIAVLAFAFGIPIELVVVIGGTTVTAGFFDRWEATCILIAVIGSAFSTVPDTYLRVSQRPFAVVGFQLGQFALMAAAGILLVSVLGRGARGAVEAMALANGLAGVVACGYVGVRLRGSLTRTLFVDALRLS